MGKMATDQCCRIIMITIKDNGNITNKMVTESTLGTCHLINLSRFWCITHTKELG